MKRDRPDAPLMGSNINNRLPEHRSIMYLHANESPVVTAGEPVDSDPVFHTIIAVDMVGSGSLPVRTARRLRKDLQSIMMDAFRQQDIDWESLHRDDLGDGFRVLVPLRHPAVRLVGPLVNHLDAALREHRMHASEVARLRLRLVVHHGLISFDGIGWTGDALVLAARLLDSDPLRQALRENPEVNFAMIVSEAIYNDVILNEYGPPVSAFYRVEVKAKETRTHAWIYISPAGGRARRRAPALVQPPADSDSKRPWGKVAAILGTVVSVAGLVVAVATPEIRCWLGLNGCDSASEAPSSHSSETSSVSTTPTGWPETAGNFANTWTDYHSAGGAAGPIIPKGYTVIISCRVVGFAVADGNTWWYRISSPPWNDQYYASADAFYNAPGLTAGPLSAGPFVDESVPEC